jgi:hypothetical protein
MVPQDERSSRRPGPHSLGALSLSFFANRGGHWVALDAGLVTRHVVSVCSCRSPKAASLRSAGDLMIIFFD